MTPAQRRRRRRAQAESTTEPQREFSPSNPPAADSLGARIDISAIVFRDLTDRVAEMKEQQELTAEAVEELTRLVERLVILMGRRDKPGAGGLIGSNGDYYNTANTNTSHVERSANINLDNPLNL